MILLLEDGFEKELHIVFVFNRPLPSQDRLKNLAKRPDRELSVDMVLVTMSEREMDKVKESGYSRETKISPTSQRKMFYFMPGFLGAFTGSIHCHARLCFRQIPLHPRMLSPNHQICQPPATVPTSPTIGKLQAVNRQKQGLYNSPSLHISAD